MKGFKQDIVGIFFHFISFNLVLILVLFFLLNLFFNLLREIGMIAINKIDKCNKSKYNKVKKNPRYRIKRPYMKY